MRYRGHIQALGRSVEVALEFASLEFDVLPQLYLVDRSRDVPEMVAHIEREDRVCYAAQGSVILDRYRPAESALSVLGMAAATIERSLSADAQTDVRAEFPQHWLSDAKLHIALDQQAPTGPAEIFSVPRGKWEEILVLARDLGWLEPFDAALKKVVVASRRPATFLRTQLLRDVPARRPPETFGDLLDWATLFDPGVVAAIMRGARSAYRKLPTVVLATPIGVVGAELHLPRILEKGIQRPAGFAAVLDRRRYDISVRRLAGTPMDTDYMLGRNLGERPGLAGLRIVLVGCGTIGSHLARHLAQSGAGRHGILTLVDPDGFAAGNVGRNLLGPGAIGLSKAEALVELIRKDFPGSEFKAVAESIMACRALLAGADLVIDATGEEAVSIALNDAVLKLRPNAPAALFVYLCGAGRAAQALLVDPREPRCACFKCLKPEPKGLRTGWPILPDIGSGEIPAACGEDTFTPYGVAAPAIAAGLAMAICLDWVADTLSPRLRTIRVDARATVPVDDVDLERHPFCPACLPDLAV